MSDADTIPMISEARANEIFETYWSLWPNRRQCSIEMGIDKQRVYRAFENHHLLQAELDERVMAIAKAKEIDLFRVDLSRYRAWRGG